MEPTPRHLLLVDDCRMNRMIVTRCLPPGNFQITEAEDGVEAIRKVNEAEHIDLIFLDLVMPNMDGLDTLAALRADARTRDIPVVIVSALDDPNDIAAGMELGADAFLTLPLDPRRVAQLTEDILSLRAEAI